MALTWPLSSTGAGVSGSTWRVSALREPKALPLALGVAAERDRGLEFPDVVALAGVGCLIASGRGWFGRAHRSSGLCVEDHLEQDPWLELNDGCVRRSVPQAKDWVDVSPAISACGSGRSTSLSRNGQLVEVGSTTAVWSSASAVRVTSSRRSRPDWSEVTIQPMSIA